MNTGATTMTPTPEGRALVDLVNAWRDLARDQDIIIETKELSEAEHDWHAARSQQAEDCADELEAALAAMQQPGDGEAEKLAATLERVHRKLIGMAVNAGVPNPERGAPLLSAADLLRNHAAKVARLEEVIDQRNTMCQSLFNQEKAANERADAATGLLERIFSDLIAGSKVEPETEAAIGHFIDPQTFTVESEDGNG